MQSVYLQRIMKKNAAKGYEKTNPIQTQFPPAPPPKTPATGSPVAEKLTGKKLIILSLDSSVSAV